jgi:hypothetical protein
MGGGGRAGARAGARAGGCEGPGSGGSAASGAATARLSGSWPLNLHPSPQLEPRPHRHPTPAPLHQSEGLPFITLAAAAEGGPPGEVADYVLNPTLLLSALEACGIDNARWGAGRGPGPGLGTGRGMF